MVERGDIPKVKKALNELTSWTIGEAKKAAIEAHEAMSKEPPDTTTAGAKFADFERFSAIAKDLTTTEKNIAEGYEKHYSGKDSFTWLLIPAAGVLGLLAGWLRRR